MAIGPRIRVRDGKAEPALRHQCDRRSVTVMGAPAVFTVPVPPSAARAPRAGACSAQAPVLPSMGESTANLACRRCAVRLASPHPGQPCGAGPPCAGGHVLDRARPGEAGQDHWYWRERARTCGPAVMRVLSACPEAWCSSTATIRSWPGPSRIARIARCDRRLPARREKSWIPQLTYPSVRLSSSRFSKFKIT